jgi:poly(3-hydroxybutyrate) depolymerase
MADIAQPTEKNKDNTVNDGDHRLSLVGIAGDSKPSSHPSEHAPGTLAAGKTSEQSIGTGADKRTFDVHVPKDWDGKSSLPVMYYFNGMRPDGKHEPESFTGLSDRADKMGFAVVYMHGSNEKNQTYNNGQKYFANSTDESSYLNAVHESLAKQLPLDENRQGLAGFSQGGSEIYNLAATNKWVASVQSVEGYMTGYEQPLNHPVSEQNIHALHDPIIPENGTEQVCAQADRELQSVLDSMRYGGEGYFDPKMMLHSETCEIEKKGNFIEPQRYIVDAYKKADGIDGDGQTTKTPDTSTYDFRNPTTGAEVRQITLQAGTHGWAGSSDHSGDMMIIGQPNEKVSASDEMAKFLLDHPLIKDKKPG